MAEKKFIYNGHRYTIDDNLVIHPLTPGVTEYHASRHKAIWENELKTHLPNTENITIALHWVFNYSKLNENLDPGTYKFYVRALLKYFDYKTAPFIILLTSKPEQITEKILEMIINSSPIGTEFDFIPFVPEPAVTENIVNLIETKGSNVYRFLPKNMKTKERSRRHLENTPETSYYVPPELRPELFKEVFGVDVNYKPEPKVSPKEAVYSNIDNLTQEELINLLPKIAEKITNFPKNSTKEEDNGKAEAYVFDIDDGF